MNKFFKVIDIVDDTRIIVNYGNDNTFMDKDIVGTEIKIVEKGIDIKDPETQEVIGQYNPVKEKLIITDVYNKFSIARKKSAEDKPAISDYALSPTVLTESKTHFKTLKVNVQENKNLHLKSSIISIGDLVEIDE